MHDRYRDDARTQQLMRLEEMLWTGGADVYEEHLASDALMVFPSPVGVLERGETVQSIRSADRWQEVSLDEARTLPVAGDVVALVYQASATRAGQDEPYRAAVTSTYRRVGEGWELVLHQQSPAGG